MDLRFTARYIYNLEFHAANRYTASQTNAYEGAGQFACPIIQRSKVYQAARRHLERDWE